MENMQQELTRLQSEFRDCQKLLNALGNETRQYLLYVLLDGPRGGRRVIELARRTHLSRPSISHHIQILKEAGGRALQKRGNLHLLLSGSPGR